MIKNLPDNAADADSIPGSGRFPGEGSGNPRKFHGQRNLVGYSLWGCKESDMTEYTHTHKCTKFKSHPKLSHPRTIRSLGKWQYLLKI